MIEYLFSHQEGLDLFALLPKRLKRINGVPVDEWLKAHEHEERTCHMTHDESASRAMCGPAVRCSACNAARNYDSPYGSAKATARMVERAAGDLASVFIEERERLKEVE